MESIDPLYLMSVGFILIALEAFTPLFIFLWFGVASIITASLTYFNIISDIKIQIIVIAVLSLLLLFSLRNIMIKKILNMQEKEIKDDFLNVTGEGIIKEGKVYFKATFWNIDSDEENFQEGEKVIVLETFGNSAKIKRK